MEDEKRERLPHFPKSLGMSLYKGLARGEVFAKDFPKTSPRPPPLELVLQSGLASPAIGGLGLNKNLKNRILQVPLKNWGKC